MRLLSLSLRRDASSLVVRPISRGDRAALQAAFDRLSPTSRYRRFLFPKAQLSEAELTFLTEPDPAFHRALVAEDARTGDIIGVARYVRAHDDRDSAELAFAVIDEWHRRGVGRRLVRDLIRLAHGDGIGRLTATTLAENHPSRGLLSGFGFKPAAFFGDTIDFALPLAAPVPASRAA